MYKRDIAREVHEAQEVSFQNDSCCKVVLTNSHNFLTSDLKRQTILIILPC